MSGTRSFRFRLFWVTACALIVALIGAFFFGMHMFFRHIPRFMMWHVAVFGSFAAAFVFGGLWQIKRGLSEFNQMRARLSDVREGRADRIDGSYPAEVQPLVNDLNTLLEHRERAIERAQTKAGDLAHGLKTPLALLSHEAERATASGQHELAATIIQQVDRMQRHVHYHLTQARAAASGATLGARTMVSESADALIRTLQKLHAEKQITIESTIPSDDGVQVQREDLDEMLGNLLDNAFKWAKTRVTITSSPDDTKLAILIDDDGPGLDPAKRDHVLQRGIRADEEAPGSGLGLAIVRDLAGVYGGMVSLESSPLGGLRARLLLPRS